MRSVINKCVKCFRARSREMSYQMGNLPAVRVTAARAFENTGVDYCGPFLIKEKKLGIAIK